jgi:hypothetical protein
MTLAPLYMVMICACLIFYCMHERVVVGAREVLEARDACERVVVRAHDAMLIQLLRCWW